MKPMTSFQFAQHQAGFHDWDRRTARLQWLYGADRTEDILDGTDGPTRADVAAWKRLGLGRKV